MSKNNISVDRDLAGTLHIKVGEFDFIQIQYQYPYTDNASTRRLAERIARMLVETDAEAPIAQAEQRAQVAGVPVSLWTRLTDRMPDPDEHGRVLIYTEGYDFGGEQVFDVVAETLNECFFESSDEQPEVLRFASHWMPIPAVSALAAAPSTPAAQVAVPDVSATEAQSALAGAGRDGLPLVIAGAIFDFSGFLTTREGVVEVGATANASPVADLIQEWAELRGLSLADAAVLSWQDLLAAAPAPVVPEVPALWAKSLGFCWAADADYPEEDWIVGTVDEDGNRYDVLRVEASQYDAAGESQKIAEAIVALWAWAAHPAERQEQGEVQMLREALEHCSEVMKDPWKHGEGCISRAINRAAAALAASTGQEVGK